MTFARPIVQAALLILAVVPVCAQAPTVDLAKRTARSRYALGQVIDLRELADGRVVVSDRKEGLFRVVDFQHNDVGILGEQGDDPGQYRRASQMIVLPGDSIGMIDGANARVMHVSAQGGIGSFTPMPRATRRLAQLLGSDSAGALYFATMPAIDTALRGIAAHQSVTRLAGDGQADQPLVEYRNRNTEKMARGFTPFSFADAIAVRSDGVIARVTADSYQVTWYRNGKESASSGPIAYTPIAITDAEQTALRDSLTTLFKSMTAGAAGARTTSFGGAAPAGGSQNVFINGGGGAPIALGSGMSIAALPAGGGSSAAGGASASAAPPTSAAAAALSSAKAADMIGDFPPFKPAIAAGQGAVLFDRDGRLWILREHARADLVPHYDVVDEHRGVVAHVNFPSGTRIAGFGRGVIYLARADQGSDWLERYAMPTL